MFIIAHGNNYKKFFPSFSANLPKKRMMEEHLREQVEQIREVFSYIHRFKDSLFVLRIHSGLMDHPQLPQLISDLALLHENGIHIIIVPGARKQIDQILDAHNVDTNDCRGVRLSSAEAIPFIKMAAFDVCNRIMTLLSARGKNALIGNWVKARSLGVIDGVDYQFTGAVGKVQTDSIAKALNEGYIPIFPCIGWNDTGDAYNISSDELAGSLSISLKSRKLFFIQSKTAFQQADLKIPSGLSREEGGRISKLTVEKASILLQQNPEMQDISVLSHALKAAESGVDRVHIVNGTIEGVILKEIFSNLGIGSMVFANIYEKIRSMQLEDIPGVLSLMAPLIDKGLLVSRSRRELEEKSKDYVVYAVDDILHGTAALHLYENDQAEIAGLAVDSQYIKLQIGQKLVRFLIEKAEKEGLKKVFVLTTQAYDWFLKLGFKPGSVEDLPASKQKNYNRDRNSRILIYTCST